MFSSRFVTAILLCPLPPPATIFPPSQCTYHNKPSVSVCAVCNTPWEPAVAPTAAADAAYLPPPGFAFVPLDAAAGGADFALVRIGGPACGGSGMVRGGAASGSGFALASSGGASSASSSLLSSSLSSFAAASSGGGMEEDADDDEEEAAMAAAVASIEAFEVEVDMVDGFEITSFDDEWA